MQDSEDTIINKFTSLYPDQGPTVLAAIRKMVGGADQYLDDVWVWNVNNQYWHYVSLGMTELYDKESDNEDESGWGFEFTFKLAKKSDETTPPVWPAVIIKKLARFVYENSAFDDCHYISFGEPIENSDYVGFVFSTDHIVGELESSTGKFKFLEIYCVTQEDLDKCFSSKTANEELIKKIREENPDFVNKL